MPFVFLTKAKCYSTAGPAPSCPLAGDDKTLGRKSCYCFWSGCEDPRDCDVSCGAGPVGSGCSATRLVDDGERYAAKGSLETLWKLAS